MTARLLPHDKLTALLESRCHGETMGALAERYGVTLYQVKNLLDTHKTQYQTIREKLGFGPLSHRKLTPGNHKKTPLQSSGGRPGQNIKRKCLRCNGQFWTSSSVIRICTPCKHSEGWKQGYDSRPIGTREGM